MVDQRPFDIFKMRAIFKSFWVRKLIGKLGVPYNRRLRVRGSPHPLFYDADLSFPAAVSNAFRIQPDFTCPERLMASWTVLDSSGANRAPIRIPLNSAFLTLGRPIFLFLILFNIYVDGIII
jgi:hypothetical protein